MYSRFDNRLKIATKTMKISMKPLGIEINRQRPVELHCLFNFYGHFTNKVRWWKNIKMDSNTTADGKGPLPHKRTWN